jgi:hypothetical protein
MTSNIRNLTSFNKRIEGMTIDDIVNDVFKNQCSPLFKTSLSLLELLKKLDAARTKQVILEDTYVDVKPIQEYLSTTKDDFFYIINLLEYFTIESTEEFNLEEIEFIKKKIFSIMDALSFLMVQIKRDQLIKAECGMIYSDMRIAVDHLLYIRSNIRIETSIERFHKEIVKLQDVLEDMSALETKSPTYKEAKHSNLSFQYFANQLKCHIEEILTIITSLILQ